MALSVFLPEVTVLREVPVDLTPGEVLRVRQGSLRPALREAAAEAVRIGRTLVEPAAVMREVEVRSVSGPQVTLLAGGEVALTVGPKADLLAPARRALAAVCTIGPALERRVHELQSAGEALLAYLLDCVGVVALGAVGEALRRHAEDRAGSLGWGVSPLLAPGSLVGWPVTGQRDVCHMLPLDVVGVRLNDHGVLVPHKSASALIGLGPGYPSTHVGSVCGYCALVSTCWRRREGGAA